MEGSNLFTDYFFKTDLKYRVSYTRQLLKHWHLLNFITPWSRVLDIGSGNCDVGRLMKDNDLKGRYFPVDIAVRGEVLPEQTFKVELNLCEQSLEDKLKELDIKKSFDVIVIYDFLQNVDIETGKKVLKQISKFCHENTIVSICFRTGKYVQDYEEKSYLNEIDWKSTKKYLEDECGLKVINEYGLRYGESWNSIRIFTNRFKSGLFKRIDSFLPDEVARNILGICLLFRLLRLSISLFSALIRLFLLF